MRYVISAITDSNNYFYGYIDDKGLTWSGWNNSRGYGKLNLICKGTFEQIMADHNYGDQFMVEVPELPFDLTIESIKSAYPEYFI